MVEQVAVDGFAGADGEIRTLTTRRGPLPVAGVVVAAGLASRGLARHLGLRVPMQTERGYHLMLEDAGARFAIPVTSAERGFVLTPMTGGLRLAGTVELADAEIGRASCRARVCQYV